MSVRERLESADDAQLRSQSFVEHAHRQNVVAAGVYARALPLAPIAVDDGHKLPGGMAARSCLWISGHV
jgi:hypothetical protein